MAKKRASAAQLRARARFSAIMRSGGFGKKKRSKSVKRTRKVNITKRVIHTMARKRSGGRRFTRRGIRGSLGSARSIFKDVSAGVGGAVVAQEIANRVMPQASPIAGYAGAYIAGGTRGIIGKVAVDAITGQSGILNMFGGGGAQGGDSL